jgi:hypothetical protein
MKRLPGIVLFMLLLGACSGPTPEEMASLAAKGYYDHLLRGEYQQFLEGKSGADSLPDAYREQLLVGYKQFMALQQKNHRGIREVRISNAKTDSLEKYTSVFLVLCFGDSTNEEVVVPMVEQQGRWRMK